MSNRIRNIFFIIGIISVLVMLFTLDVSFQELWKNVQRAGYWMVAILGLWGVLYVMNALSWRIIIRGSGDCPVPFWKIAKVTVTGFALNYATPVGLLGGEPYKIMEFTPYLGAQRASSSVVLFAMMHVFSHFWYWVTAMVLYLVLVALGLAPLGTGMVVILVMMAMFCAAGLYLFILGYKNGMVRKLFAAMSHIPGLKRWSIKFAESHEEDLRRIDEQIAALHSQNRRSFYQSLLCEYVGRVCQSFEIMFMLILFGAGTFSIGTFTNAFIILAFTSLFANLLFFMPLQLGGREGGFVMTISQLGMTTEIGIFVSLMCRVREIFWTVIGLMLMKLKE